MPHRKGLLESYDSQYYDQSQECYEPQQLQVRCEVIFTILYVF